MNRIDVDAGEIDVLDPRLENNWIQVPLHLFFATDVSDGAKLTYSGILRYRRMEKGKAYPGHRRLSIERGVTTATIKRQITELREKKWINVQTRTGDTNVYQFLPFPVGDEVLPWKTGGVKNEPPGGVKNDPPPGSKTTQPPVQKRPPNQREGVKEKKPEKKQIPLSERAGVLWGVENVAGLAGKVLEAWGSTRRLATTPNPRRDFAVFHKIARPVIEAQGIGPEEFAKAVKVHEETKINGRQQYGQSWPAFASQLDNILIRIRAQEGRGNDGREDWGAPKHCKII